MKLDRLENEWNELPEYMKNHAKKTYLNNKDPNFSVITNK